MNPTWLLDFRADVHSQIGEDGVVAKILELIPEKDKWCVEFGAWDGRHLSTTCNLIEGSGYRAVLIEGSAEKFADLKRNHAKNNVIALNRFVGFSQRDNLDTLLADTPIPRTFDFLSIDIDGNDYHVWKACARYEPKVVAIEFNPTIPTEVAYVQDADPSVSRGCSLLALVELGKAKGYELVCVLPYTAFFVRQPYFPLFNITDNRPATLRTDLSMVTYLFAGYDGTVLLAGNRRLPWHDIELDAEAMQVLPRRFRAYPGNYSPATRWWFNRWRWLRGHPKTNAEKLNC
jgi:hypothetical protein